MPRAALLLWLLLMGLAPGALLAGQPTRPPGAADEPRSAALKRLDDALKQIQPADPAAPRRRFITAGTTDPRYRAYLERWSRAVQYATVTHYLPPAGNEEPAGTVILSVAVRRDGAIERIDLIRSSKHAALDRAAIEGVRQAAPFDPIPQHEHIDILVITRTFEFRPRAKVTLTAPARWPALSRVIACQILPINTRISRMTTTRPMPPTGR